MDEWGGESVTDTGPMLIARLEASEKHFTPSIKSTGTKCQRPISSLSWLNGRCCVTCRFAGGVTDALYNPRVGEFYTAAGLRVKFFRMIFVVCVGWKPYWMLNAGFVFNVFGWFGWFGCDLGWNFYFDLLPCHDSMTLFSYIFSISSPERKCKVRHARCFFKR